MILTPDKAGLFDQGPKVNSNSCCDVLTRGEPFLLHPGGRQPPTRQELLYVYVCVCRRNENNSADFRYSEEDTSIPFLVDKRKIVQTGKLKICCISALPVSSDQTEVEWSSEWVVGSVTGICSCISSTCISHPTSGLA